MRADLHVHTRHSGLTDDLAFLRSLDCYSSPGDVYRVARARGMDLVTITDHDSLDGCLELLDAHPDAPDILVGEEVTCWWPGCDLEVHVGAYGISEAVHREIQPLRDNVHEVVACLRASGAVAIINHPLHFYRFQVPLADYLALIAMADGVEARNGAMLPAHNALAVELAAMCGGRCVAGGSDAHALHRIGRTWTEAPASSRDEFLASLRAGTTRVGGAHGSTAALAGDIYRVIGQYWLALAGRRASGLSLPRRALGMVFSGASLPFQFTPLLVAAQKKRREARAVRACRSRLGLPSNGALSADAVVSRGTA
jgi:predicted metal-dependent phosphoesterase TrpH